MGNRIQTFLYMSASKSKSDNIKNVILKKLKDDHNLEEEYIFIEENSESIFLLINFDTHREPYNYCVTRTIKQFIMWGSEDNKLYNIYSTSFQSDIESQYMCDEWIGKLVVLHDNKVDVKNINYDLAIPVFKIIKRYENEKLLKTVV